MGRNNERNIKAHNDKLHKAADKAKKAASLLKERRTAMVRKFNAENGKTEDEQTKD